MADSATVTIYAGGGSWGGDRVPSTVRGYLCEYQLPTAILFTKLQRWRRPRETGKQNMKRMCRILFNLKGGTKFDIYYRMDGTWGHSVKGNDHIRRQVLYGSTHRRNL